jgi:hypothetical protein
MLLTTQLKRRTEGPLDHLRAAVLLGGSVRATHLSASLGRSVLNLPVDQGLSLLGHWQSQLECLSRRARLQSLPIRLVLDRGASEPDVEGPAHVPVLVERDRSEFRGTGGVLRDMLEGYEDDDMILVANALQLVLEPVADLVSTMAEQGADVCVVSQEDGVPGGFMLLRCAAVRQIAPIGYVDMKEQALPAIARQMRVDVVKRPAATALPVRTAGEYLYGLGRYHRQMAGRAGYDDPYTEDWEPAFGLVEDGAVVDGGAVIHDSVVLKGAKVGAGAVLVRCLLCPGAQVRPGEIRVDEQSGPPLNGRGGGNGQR